MSGEVFEKKMLNERNEKIDEIGRRLTRQNALSEANFERIVNAPQTWQGVCRRIEAEKTSRTGRTSVFELLRKTFEVNQLAFRFAFASVFMFGATFGLWIFVSHFALSDNSDFANANEIDVPRIIEYKSVDIEPKVNEVVDAQNSPNREAQIKSTKIRFVPKNNSNLDQNKIVVKTQVTRNLRTRQDFVAAKRKTQIAPKSTETPNESTEEQSEFYALTFAGNSNANEMKQIVRVKLSPAALVKLGVSNSLAMIDNSVTADLLLGEDGSPQAIRFIR